MRFIVSKMVFIVAATVVGLTAEISVCRAADPSQAKPVELTAEQRAEQIRIWEERHAARRAADVKIFLKDFEAGQKLTVRERLDRAATVSVELAGKAENLVGNPLVEAFPQKGFGTRATIYPRASHIARLVGVRPWLREYPGSQHGLWRLKWDTAKYEWPTMKDHDELKRLLNDDDADIGIMAAEALATLCQPEDLHDLRSPEDWDRETHQTTPTIPVLSTHNGYGGGQQGGGLTNDFDANGIMMEDDPLMYPTYWKQATIGEYYDRALQQLTGANVARETLHQWTTEHGDDRESVWYWEYRFYRDYQRFQRTIELAPPSYRLSDKDLAAFRKPLQEEIGTLGRLTEARILLTLPGYNIELRRNGEIDRNQHIDSRVYNAPWKTRLTNDEIFRLLEGERLWPSPRPSEKPEYYEPSDSELVTRLLQQPQRNFSVEDVPRLQRVLFQTKLNLTPPAIDIWHLAISKLLPPAAPGMLDDPSTRDGYLRQRILEHDSISKSLLVKELARVSLPANAKWLEELFFTKDTEDSTISRFAPTILTALQSRSPTRDQQKLLWSLVTDDRFRPIWIHGREHFRNGLRRSKSLNAHRHPAAVAAYRAVSAQAGREFMPWEEYHQLMSPENSDMQLESLLQKLKAYPLGE